MIFKKHREVFSKSFRLQESFYIKIKKNQMFFFIFLQKFFSNLSEVLYLNVLNIFKVYQKNNILKIINLIKKYQTLFYFCCIFKNQKYNGILSSLSFFFENFTIEFEKILNKLHKGVYESWNSSFNLKKYLIFYAIYIKIIVIFIRKNISYRIYTIKWFSSQLNKKNQNSNNNRIFHLFGYYLDFDFFYLVNKLLIHDTIQDYYGNFLTLVRFKIQTITTYRLLFKKNLHPSHKKILKYSTMIRGILKNIRDSTKKHKLVKFIRTKFIFIKTTQRNVRLVLFLKFFLKKISNFVFSSSTGVPLLCIQSFLFFFRLSVYFLHRFFFTTSVKKNFLVWFLKFFNKCIYFQNDLQWNKENFQVFCINKCSLYRTLEKNNLAWIFMTKNSIEKYKILSTYVFKTEFIKNKLICVWKFHKLMFYFKFFKIVQLSISLNRMLLSFFKFFIEYSVFDIFNNKWVLIYKQNRVSGVFSAAYLHEKFLNQCLKRCQLVNSYVSKVISRIFIITDLFSLFMKRILGIFLHRYRSVKNHFLYTVLIFKKNYKTEFYKINKILHKTKC